MQSECRADEPARPVVLFGELVVDVFPDRRVLGGAPFNVARHLAAFGVESLLISRSGGDRDRDTFLDAMAAFGLDPSGVQTDPRRPTGQVLVSDGPAGPAFDIRPRQAYDRIQAAAALPALRRARPRWLYFGTLAQRAPASRRTLAALLREGGAARFLDLNLRPPWYRAALIESALEQADFLKLNADECLETARLLGLGATGQDAFAAALFRRLPRLATLVVTRGAAGAARWDRNGGRWDVGAPPAVTVTDTVGAGDAFAAVLLLGALSDWHPALTLERAQQLAAAVCTVRGAVPRDDAFYAPLRRRWGEQEEKPDR